MIISSNYDQFCNYGLSFWQLLKFFGEILDSFKVWKFQTHNTKSMRKYNKFNIAVTIYQQLKKCSTLDDILQLREVCLPHGYINFSGNAVWET
jgi:hypothetical protein